MWGRVQEYNGCEQVIDRSSVASCAERVAADKLITKNHAETIITLHGEALRVVTTSTLTMHRSEDVGSQ